MCDHGYMYPGPAIKDVPLAMARAESRATIRKFGRPEYSGPIADNPIEPPRDAKPLVATFQKWDREIGAKKTKDRKSVV